MQAVRHCAIVFKPRTGRIEQRIGFKKVLAYYIIIGTAFYFHKSAGRIMFVFVARGFPAPRRAVDYYITVFMHPYYGIVIVQQMTARDMLQP